MLDVTAYRRLRPATGAEWEFGRVELLDGRSYFFADRESFYLGAYGGFWHWLYCLRQYAPEGSFAELPETDSVIGAQAAARLAREFAKHEASILRQADEDDAGWFISFYRKLRQAFEMAADGGQVRIE